MIVEQCKGVNCVNLGESFQTHIYLQKLASIQKITSSIKFDRLAQKLSGPRRTPRRLPPHEGVPRPGDGGAEPAREHCCFFGLRF